MFELRFSTSNAAFCDPNTGDEDEYYEAQEIARLLEEIAEKIKSCNFESGSVMDYNGNKIGAWRY